MGQDPSPKCSQLFANLRHDISYRVFISTKTAVKKLKFRITFVPFGTDLLVLTFVRWYIFPSRIPVVSCDLLWNAATVLLVFAAGLLKHNWNGLWVMDERNSEKENNLQFNPDWRTETVLTLIICSKYKKWAPNLSENSIIEGNEGISIRFYPVHKRNVIFPKISFVHICHI